MKRYADFKASPQSSKAPTVTGYFVMDNGEKKDVNKGPKDGVFYHAGKTKEIKYITKKIDDLIQKKKLFLRI